jgi:DNA-binding transcriptional ArsR family regulator
MSATNASRRNRAHRKIRTSRHLSSEIKITIAAILDLLSPKSDYCLAWPSAATLARRIGKSRRTVLWHLKAIKELGIFTVHRFSPQGATAFVQKKYGIEINLERCRCQAPNLFEVSVDHPLWDESKTIPPEVENEWKQIVKQVKDSRNTKTTSRLSSDITRRPEVSMMTTGDRPNGSRRSLPIIPLAGYRRF